MTNKAVAVNTGEVVLRGELFIQRVAELKEELQQALESVDALLINLVETTDIDLSGLQLLCSVHRAAREMNKDLKLVGLKASIVEETLQLAGFSEPVGCDARDEGTCPWIGESDEGASCTVSGGKS